MADPTPLTEDQARVALARAGAGGGFDATRVAGGWVFTYGIARDDHVGTVAWLVSDTGAVRPLTEPVHRTADLLREMGPDQPDA